jgi:hypothetical protein
MQERNEMQLMALILLLFTFISITGFIGAIFFGAAGAAALMVLGLAISFIGIAFFIGR